VLFHCWAGASRSPSVAAGFLRARRGYSVRAAVDAFLRRPPTVDAWLPFLSELL
jgi:protein-tyrosine phosphatase